MSRNRLFALDTWFYNSLGSYNYEAKCEMLNELGYDGINLTLWSDESWADAPRIATTRKRFGIEVTGVYASIANEDDTLGIARLRDLLETLDGCRLVDLAILGSRAARVNSDPTGDAAIIRVLEAMLPLAEKRGITVSLYHHVNAWMERLDDAVRLHRALGHPNLKMTFSSHHWYVTDGRSPEKTIKEVLPNLAAANFCGSRRVPNDTGTAATIELIDDGEQDNFYLLGLLARYGFDGPIGLQGFSIGGDVYSKLRRSIAAYRDIQARIERHPEWLDFRMDPIPSARAEKRA
jgi:sugar phosphate isomerase/epimerase